VGRGAQWGGEGGDFLAAARRRDFTGPFWVRPGRGPGMSLLPRPVGNCPRRWRTVSSGWLFRGCPAVSPFLPYPPRRLYDGSRYMGVSPRMPVRRPREVDCMGVWTAGRRCGGDGLGLWTMWVAKSGLWGLLVLAMIASPRSCVGSSARRMSMVEGTKCGEGFSGESPALRRQRRRRLRVS
jgi:hypothetical protein